MVPVSLRSSLALLSLCKPSVSFTTTRRAAFSYWSSTTAGLLTTTAFTRPAFGQDLSSSSCASRSAGSNSSPKQRGLSMTSSSRSTLSSTGHLNAADAVALDQELMQVPGFSLEQLMELAGLSVAEAVYQVVEEKRQSSDAKPKILVVCGPGNNGGDGLVAARHLVMFGYDALCVYPKQSKGIHFTNLVRQCEDVGIDVVKEMPADETLSKDYAAIVDAIFGFSFKGEPREPFASILKTMKQVSEQNNLLTISVDVPSGWNVDEGDVAKTGFSPNILISLTTPKHCSKEFKGRHFVGGRFLPPKLAEKYGVQMPPYPGVAQVMEVSSSTETGAKL